MALIINNHVYTCDCYLNNLSNNFVVMNKQLIETKIIYKCNSCECKIFPQYIPLINNKPFLKGCDDVYGFCDKCCCFVKNNEVFKDFEKINYNIIKKPYLGKGCEKCYNKDVLKQPYLEINKENT